MVKVLKQHGIALATISLISFSQEAFAMNKNKQAKLIEFRDPQFRPAPYLNNRLIGEIDKKVLGACSIKDLQTVINNTNFDDVVETNQDTRERMVTYSHLYIDLIVKKNGFSQEEQEFFTVLFHTPTCFPKNGLNGIHDFSTVMRHVDECTSVKAVGHEENECFLVKSKFYDQSALRTYLNERIVQQGKEDLERMLIELV